MTITETTAADAPYTRFELSNYKDGQGHSQSFQVYDNPALGVSVITTTFSNCWVYPMTQVAVVTREEAREIWKRSAAQGLKQEKPFRQERFGAIPAKAA